MNEKPMTPHERAVAVVVSSEAWPWLSDHHEQALVAAITTALQAQSNADELRHREKQQALRDLLAEAEKRAEQQLGNAELRRPIAYADRYHINPQPLYPGEFHQADVKSLNGADFRGAALIVASPPCEDFSRHAMPWTRRRNPPPPDLSIAEACWRIQREAGVPPRTSDGAILLSVLGRRALQLTLRDRADAIERGEVEAGDGALAGPAPNPDTPEESR